MSNIQIDIVAVIENKNPVEVLMERRGRPGTSGAGVPAGGTTGQFLRKINGTDYNTEWAAVPSINELNDIGDVIIIDVANGEILVKTALGWENRTLAEAGISATGHTHTASEITDFSSGVNTLADARIAAQKGFANGLATLDATSKIPLSQLPAAILGAANYQGGWNATTNTPSLSTGVGTKGFYYVVNTAGSTNLDGITEWKIGDWVIFNGTIWEKVDNTDAVISVNGFIGAVILNTSNISEVGNLYFTDLRAVTAVGGSKNDSGSGTSDFWSASKITSELAGKAAAVHTHDDRYYTETEMDSLLALKAALVHVHTVSDITDFVSASETIADARITLQKGAANGLATLDATSKIPLSQIPSSILGAANYQGAWNATTNSPSLATGVGTKGYYYVVDTAGSTNLDGITEWKIGDWVIFNGTAWQKIDNTDAVISVNGFIGAVTLTTGDIAESGSTNLYFSNARAVTALTGQNISIFVNNSGYISSTAGDWTGTLDGVDGTGYLVTTPGSLTRNLIIPSGDFIGLTIRPHSSQTVNIWGVQNNAATLDYIYTEIAGHTRIGAKAVYTSGPFTYRDSHRLYFDYYFNGSRQNNYIECVPNSPGGQNQAVMNFIVSGQTQFQVSGVSGPGAPLGMTAGGWVIGAGGGATMRTANTAAGTIRGEFNTITIQGETNTAGAHEFKVVGKNPFGGATASNLAGFFNDTVLKFEVDTNGRISEKAGTSTVFARVAGRIYDFTTQVNNVTTGETDLCSQAIGANILATNKDALHFVYAGTIQTSLNNKQLKVYFGATVIYDSTAQNPAIATNWIIEGWIFRTGAATQKAIVKLNTSQGSLYTFTGFASPTETLSGAVTLKITGQGGASNEITFEAGMIEWQPAA